MLNPLSTITPVRSFALARDNMYVSGLNVNCNHRAQFINMHRSKHYLNIKQKGFTIMELLVVLMLIALLASIVTPVVTKSIVRAKESTLKENLFIMRKALDDYYADNGRYPEMLEDLTEKKYLRFIPVDPLNDQLQWDFSYTDNEQTQQAPGIIDIHSQSTEQASDGSNYNEW